MRIPCGSNGTFASIASALSYRYNGSTTGTEGTRKTCGIAEVGTPALLAGGTAALAAFIAPAALAQTPSALGEWQYSAGIPLKKLYQPNLPDWEVRVGVGSTFGSRYDGSDRYRALVGPSMDIRYRDLAFASTGEGIGVNVVQGPNWRASISAVYDLGRRGHDDPSRLNGLGNINPAPELKLAAEYVVSKQFPLVFRAAVTRSFVGSNGSIADLDTYMPMPGSSDKFFWFAGPSVTFADSNYMSSWYGVNATQAAASRYRQYDANAGLKSAGFGITLIWFIDKHWFITADGALKRLLGSAALSPITQTKTKWCMRRVASLPVLIAFRAARVSKHALNGSLLRG